MFCILNGVGPHNWTLLTHSKCPGHFMYIRQKQALKTCVLGRYRPIREHAIGNECDYSGRGHRTHAGAHCRRQNPRLVGQGLQFVVLRRWRFNARNWRLTTACLFALLSGVEITAKNKCTFRSSYLDSKTCRLTLQWNNIQANMFIDKRFLLD